MDQENCSVNVEKQNLVTSSGRYVLHSVVALIVWCIYSGSSDDDGKSSSLQKINGKAWGVLVSIIKNINTAMAMHKVHACMQQFRKLRAFPFSVFFIVGNEFCERFCFYGMRGKWSTVVNQKLKL